MTRTTFLWCALAALIVVSGGAPASARAGVSAEAPRYQALAEGLVGTGQGVFAVAEDGTVLASVAADRAVHPASVSKVPSTLALLRTLGPDYRFVTKLRGAAPEAGVIPGDLVVESAGDPFLLPQGAAYILGELGDIGVRRVAGRLRVEGPLYYDWKPDPAGKRFGAVLRGKISSAARREANERRGSDGKPSVVFEHNKAASAPATETILVHLSPPLPRILKELNGYSNNIFHPLSDRVGGPAAVQRVARASVPKAMADEIVITNAAGAGKTNRLSPRAAVALYQALERELREHGLVLTDVLPVAGRDRGTLQRRFSSPELRGSVVGKTGTYGSLGASSLAGVARTRRFGKVTFAILNRDVPVAEARRRQNAFVTALLADAGAVPWPYEPLPSPILLEETVVVNVGGD
ncbi:MAG: D-alanyl-D-alanine carboxypeptidase [Candidatus Binatia bacterium]|nr:D-alanyl-D-alanine carboxypeptidase [Candidatus Binatia bacterium]